MQLMQVLVNIQLAWSSDFYEAVHIQSTISGSYFQAISLECIVEGMYYLYIAYIHISFRRPNHIFYSIILLFVSFLCLYIILILSIALEIC